MATSTSLLYLVPAFAVLIGFIWLGEVPLVSELLGGVVVIAGVVLVSLGDRILARLRQRGVVPLAHARPAQITAARVGKSALLEYVAERATGVGSCTRSASSPRWTRLRGPASAVSAPAGPTRAAARAVTRRADHRASACGPAEAPDRFLVSR
jgi:hypothetical protein